jgi:nucleoside triphosphate pyrophosphatase
MATPISARPRLILASASPRRQMLLCEAGYDFTIFPADIDELSVAGNSAPEDAAVRIADAKARAVAERFPNEVILAADTVVALGNQAIGKATDADHARQILRSLSGTTHRVITGVAVIHHRTGLALLQRVISTVEMRPLGWDEIDAYIATNQWQGKAGAYGIQDRDPFVSQVAGCLTNIVGLPMTTTRDMLRRAGIDTMSPSGC